MQVVQETVQKRHSHAASIYPQRSQDLFAQLASIQTIRFSVESLPLCLYYTLTMA